MATEPGTPPVSGRYRLARSLHRLLRSVPRVIWLITGLHMCLMASYAFLSLQYTQGDEAQNHDMVVAWMNGEGLTPPGERQLATGVLESHRLVFSIYHAPPFTNHDPPPRGERPTRGELGGDKPTTGEQPNQMTQHPPLYYAILAGIQYAIPGDPGWAWDQSVIFLRMINVLILAPLPILAWAAVRPLTLSVAAPTAAAMVPLLFPGIARVGGSINNDNLLILLGGILTALLIRVCLGNLRLRMAVAVGTVTGLALLTKGFALAFPPVVALAYLVGWRNARGGVPWMQALVAQIVAFAVGGWWWGLNLLRFGVLQPGGRGSEAREQLHGPKVPDSVPRDSLEFVQGFAQRLSNRIVAFLGRLEPSAFPFRLALVVFGVLGVGAVCTLVLRKRSDISLGVVAIALLPVVGILLIVVGGSYRHWNEYLVFSGVQGRYLYSGIIGVAVVTATGWSGLLSGTRRWLPLGLLVLAGMVQFVAAKIVVDIYWLPPGFGGLRPDRVSKAFAEIARWSPWPVGITILPFLGIVAFGVATAVDTVRLGLRGDQNGAISGKAAEPSSSNADPATPGSGERQVTLTRQ